MSESNAIHLVSAEAQAADVGAEPDEVESHFHCSAEWHLARMTPMCAPLHSFALRISRGHEGRFFASAINLGHYFACDESTIRRALNDLRKAGFLDILRQQKFQPNNYRVIDHLLWAERHPGKCITKIEFPWLDGHDPLGQELYVESGGRVKFCQFQINNLRNLNLGDAAVALEFRRFYPQAGYDWKQSTIPRRFYAHLKRKNAAAAA